MYVTHLEIFQCLFLRKPWVAFIYFIIKVICYVSGGLCAVAQAVSYQFVSMEAWLMTGLSVWTECTEADWSQSLCFNPVSHNYTVAPYSVVSYVGVIIRGCAYLET